MEHDDDDDDDDDDDNDDDDDVDDDDDDDADDDDDNDDDYDDEDNDDVFNDRAHRGRLLFHGASGSLMATTVVRHATIEFRRKSDDTSPAQTSPD